MSQNTTAMTRGGVQALSAAPEAIAKLRHLYQNMVNGAVRDTASAKRIADGLLAPAIEALERATPPAEQQAITPETEFPVSAKGAAITSESGTPTAEQEVIIDFAQVGTAGPFHVVNGRVKLPDATMQDLARMLRPTYEAEQAAPKAAPGEPVKQTVREQIAAEVATQPAAQVEFLARYLCERDQINPDQMLDDNPVRLAWHREDLNAARLLAKLAELAPRQEAQEPAFWMNEKGHTWSHSDWKQFPKHRAKYPIPLYPHFPAPQPAPAPLSEQIDKLERKLAIIAVVGVIDGHDVVRRESVLEIARRAALAAQGGNK